MLESSPAPATEYEELLQLDVEPPPPLIDRPVLVTAAERFPVDIRIPTRWVAQQARVMVGAPPVMLASDHPARTRFRLTSYLVYEAYGRLSHSAETCTHDSGIDFVTSTTEILARGAIWASAYHYDPGNPVEGAFIDLYYFTEYLEG